MSSQAYFRHGRGSLARASHRAAPNRMEPAPPPARTRAQLHKELRDSAAAIPVPLHPNTPPAGETPKRPGPAQASPLRPTPLRPSLQPNTDGRTLAAIGAPETQKLREATIPESLWLEEMRIHLRHPADPPFDEFELSTHFDEFCNSWHASPQGSRWDSTYAIGSLGVGLGDLLISRLDQARWVIYESAQRTFFAVRDDHQRVTFLPLDAVARRWHNHQLDWIAAFVDQAITGKPLGLSQ